MWPTGKQDSQFVRFWGQWLFGAIEGSNMSNVKGVCYVSGEHRPESPTLVSPPFQHASQWLLGVGDLVTLPAPALKMPRIQEQKPKRTKAPAPKIPQLSNNSETKTWVL